MRTFRSMLVGATIFGLVGCHTGPTTVVEYRPRSAASSKKASDSQVLELVRWTPIAPLSPPATQPAGAKHAPAKQMPVEVEQVYADRGSPVGFAKADGRLTAIAGQTTKPLEEAHYEWRTMPGQPTAREVSAQQRLDRAWQAIGIVAVAAVVGGLIFLIVHDNRHDVAKVFD